MKSLLILALFLNAQAFAATQVIREDAAVVQNCSIELTAPTGTIRYTNFGTQLNTFEGVSSSVPRAQRFTKTGGEVQFNTARRFSTQGNQYSNCVSSVVRVLPEIFLSEVHAKELLLVDSDGGYWDICYSDYDGAIGTGMTVIKDEAGNVVVTEGEHPIATQPGTQFAIVKRQSVQDQLGRHIDLRTQDLRTQAHQRITIEGAGEASQNLEDVHVQIKCTTELLSQK